MDFTVQTGKGFQKVGEFKGQQHRGNRTESL